MTAVVVGLVVGLLALAASGGVPRAGGRPAPADHAAEPRTSQGAVDVLLASVAASLRAGTPPARAWARAGVLATPEGVPHADSLALRTSAPPTVSGRAATPVDPRDADGHRPEPRRPSRPTAATTSAAERERQARVAAVVAASDVAVRLGAPLADTLEHVGREAVAAETRAARRRAALAGPRATARLLAWLPLIGLVVASLLGADPVRTVLGGGPGAAAVVCGSLALAAGRRWIRRLVEQAERP